MCNFASFVLTKDRVFYLDGDDSHSEIIRHFELHESGARGINILKVEIRPADLVKSWPSLDLWDYSIDQDIMPEWHIPEKDERRARRALRERFEKGFKTVNASGCTALTELKADAAKTVNASGCTALTELKADAAKTVDASGCTALMLGFAEALKYIKTLGMDKLVDNAQQLARATRIACQALGLELFSPEHPAASVTAIKAPAGLESGVIVKEFRDRFGSIIADGQGSMQGQIFRIAHLGYFDFPDLFAIIAELELILQANGVPVTLGAGVAAVQQAYAEIAIAKRAPVSV